MAFTLLAKAASPSAGLFDISPVPAPPPATNLISDLQWNNLIDILDGVAVDKISALSIAGGLVSDTEFDFLNNVSSNIQTQIDGKAASVHTHVAADVTDLNAATVIFTNKTLDDFSNVVHAEVEHIQVFNNTGGTITAGTVVYISGFNVGQDLPEILAADSSLAATMPAIGIVTADILTVAAGDVTVSGVLAATTTGFSNGDTLYVSETTGLFTNVKPQGVALIQNIGQVLKVGGAGVGRIKVTSIDRVNDLPNLPNGNIWQGDGSGVPQAVPLDLSQLPGIVTMETIDTPAILTLTPNRSTPATGVIGDLIWSDNDSIPSTQEFARIRVSSHNITSGAEEGTMAIRVVEGGTSSNYLLLNDSGFPGEIVALHQLNMLDHAIVFTNDTGTPPANSLHWIAHEFGTLWHNAPTGSQHDFAINGSSEFTIQAGEFDGKDNEMKLVRSYQFSGSTTLPSSFLGYVQYDNSQTALLLNAAAAANIKLTFEAGANATYEFNQTRALFNADNATATLELEGNHTTPSSQIAGQVDFIDDDSNGDRQIYARVFGRIEDPTQFSHDGELVLQYASGGALATGIIINEANSGEVRFGLPLGMAGANILDIGYIESNIAQVAGSGVYRMGNNQFASWRNVANTDDHEFGSFADVFEMRLNGTADYTFSATELSMQGNNLTGWTNLVSNNNQSILSTNGDLTINGATGDTITISIDSTTLMTFNDGANTDLAFAFDYADGLKQTFNPNATNAGVNVGAHTADPSVLVNGDIWYESTLNTLSARINGVTVDLGGGGGGEFAGPMTEGHDYAGFNWEGKTASPITIGQGATDLLSITFLDDTVDAGVRIGNTDGFVQITNESAVVGDNQMELLMDSGGATTIQNVMRFQIPVADDSGTVPALRMDFQDDGGGGLTRPLMEITIGATQFLEVSPGALWTFHVATIMEDINTINFNGVVNTDTTPGTFTGVSVGLAENEAIAWDGAAVGTPNSLGFTGGDVFVLNINNVQKFQISATQANFLGGIINGVDEYQFQVGTASIGGDATGAIIDSPTTTDFQIGGVSKFTMDGSFINLQQLHLRDVNSIRGDLSGTPIIIKFEEVASAVEYVQFTNGASGNGPIFESNGTAADIDLNIDTKGEGNIELVNHTRMGDNLQQKKGTDIVAAANLAPRNGNFFDVTGATQINYFVDELYFQAGSVVTLQFDSNPIVQHDTATEPTNFAPILLKGNIDFQTAAGDTLTIAFDGIDWVEIGRSSIQTPGFTMVDGEDIVIGSSTGTKIGTGTGQKIGFFNATPVVQAAALTAAETTLSFVDENTPDFSMSSLTTTSAAGFATLDEAQAFVEVVANMQIRVAELETIIANLGFSA